MGAALGLSGGAALNVAIEAMNALALVTDAFGSSGGIAQYNRDLIAALAEIPGANRIIVVPRLGDGNGAALPPGVRQLKAQGNRLSYSLTALRAAVTLGPFDFVFCGHLHLAPLAALLATRSRRAAVAATARLRSVGRHQTRRTLVGGAGETDYLRQPLYAAPIFIARGSGPIVRVRVAQYGRQRFLARRQIGCLARSFWFARQTRVAHGQPARSERAPQGT